MLIVMQFCGSMKVDKSSMNTTIINNEFHDRVLSMVDGKGIDYGLLGTLILIRCSSKFHTFCGFCNFDDMVSFKDYLTGYLERHDFSSVEVASSFSSVFEFTIIFNEVGWDTMYSIILTNGNQYGFDFKINRDYSLTLGDG